MRREELSTAQLEAVRQTAFNTHAAEKNYFVQRGLDAYSEHLGTFKGRNLKELLALQLYGHPDGINVLDIGCGAGFFCTDVAEISGVHAFGISAHDYRALNPAAANFDFTKGDAQQLASAYKDIKFDLIVSHQAFPYLGDPLIALEQAYELLSESGISLIDRFTKLTQEQESLLKQFFRRSGMEIELTRWAPKDKKYDPSMYSIAGEKRTSALVLPFRRVGIEEGYGGDYVPRVLYEFDEETVLATLEKTA